MTEPAAPPDAADPSLPAASAPSLPGEWSAKRVALLLFILAHWAAVIAEAMPADAEPASVPLGRWSSAAVEARTRLPVIDTHQDRPLISTQEVSPLVLYLSLTSQSQRWQMFTPRRQMAACMAIHYQRRNGQKELVRVADPERMSRWRWVRWRMMEWNLMSNHGVKTHVPRCQPELVEHLRPGPYRQAVLRKHFRLVPRLPRDELPAGFERFKDGESWAKSVEDLASQPLATYPNSPIRTPRKR